MQEELIELQHDGFARDVYSEKNLGDFWFTMFKSYKRIAEPAIQALLWESTFSVMLGIKSKYRSQLKTPEHDLRCLLLMFHRVLMSLLLKSRFIHHIS